MPLLRRRATAQIRRNCHGDAGGDPRRWKVIQHVREKFTCRDCEKISQAPAPFHVIARGWAGPSLSAMILFEKFGQHQPLNRQAERYAKEGVPISLSTLADQVGGCAAVLTPLFKRIEAHVLSAERLHGDDTTVPVLAKGKTVHRPDLGLRARDDTPLRLARRRPAAASLLLARSAPASIPQAHLAAYAGTPPGRRLRAATMQALRTRAAAPGSDPRSRLLGPRPPTRSSFMADIEAKNARRKAQGKTPARDLAPGAGGGPPHRRPVRHRADDQRPERRKSARRVRQELSAPLVADLEA